MLEQKQVIRETALPDTALKTVIYIASLAAFLICFTFIFNFLTLKSSPLDPILLEKLAQVG